MHSSEEAAKIGYDFTIIPVLCRNDLLLSGYSHIHLRKHGAAFRVFRCKLWARKSLISLTRWGRHHLKRHQSLEWNRASSLVQHAAKPSRPSRRWRDTETPRTM